MTDFTAWARDNRRLVITATLSILWLYGLFWHIEAPDLPEFLFPWFNHILHAGPFRAFATPFSNYSPPYLYLLAIASLVTHDPLVAIKSLAILSASCLALAIGRVLRGSPSRYEAALLSFLVPTVTINAIVYAQCDGFWASACLLAVAAARDGRNATMLCWYGIAVAFKAQAVFLAPFVVAILINRRVSPLLWVIPLAVFATAMLPAWLAGWPAIDLATVYLRQAAHFNTIGSAPNPWAIMAAFVPAEPSPVFVAGYAAATAAAIGYVLAFARRAMDADDLVRAALLSALIVPFLLPKMHERFTLLADLLSFALAYSVRDRASRRLCLAVIGASTAATFGAMFDGLFFRLLPALASFVEAAAIWMVIASLRTGLHPMSAEDDRGATRIAGMAE